MTSRTALFALLIFPLLMFQGIPSGADTGPAAGDDARLAGARRALKECDFNRAIPLYEKALKETPESTVVLLEYGICLAGVHRHQRAVRALCMVLEREPGNLAAWQYLGDTYMACHAWEQAFEAYMKVAAAMKDNTRGATANLLNLGYTCIQWRENDHASRALEQALKIDPSSLAGHIDHGLLLAVTGRVEEGRAEITSALDKGGDRDNSDAAAFGRQILSSMKGNSPLVVPRPQGTVFQVLPREFLAAPSVGRAMKLSVRDRVDVFITLTDHDLFRITVPEGWSIRKQTGDIMLTVRFDIPEGGSVLILNPVPLFKGLYKMNKVERDVSLMGADLKGRTVEEEITLFPVERGTTLYGRAFTVSDKNWKEGNPDDYPHITQGLIVSGNMPAAFTLVSHTREKPFIDGILDVLKTLEPVSD